MDIIKDTCPACRKRVRDETEYKSLINRLSRIEGQIRGIRNMLETDAYCIDIVTQASAASSALAAFERELICSHIKSCVADDIREGRGEKVDELVATLAKLLK